MSEKNVEIVRRACVEFIETHEVVTGVHAPDWVWDMRTFRGWPRKVATTGTEEFREFFEDWTGPYSEWRMELEGVRDAGETDVVILVRQDGRMKDAPSWVTLRFGVVYTVDRGKIQAARAYASQEEALEAAGLSG